ncbi:hypothetical protein Tco_0316167 [Tanacetum coccineum]
MLLIKSSSMQEQAIPVLKKFELTELRAATNGYKEWHTTKAELMAKWSIEYKLAMASLIFLSEIDTNEWKGGRRRTRTMLRVLLRERERERCIGTGQTNVYVQNRSDRVGKKKRVVSALNAPGMDRASQVGPGNMEAGDVDYMISKQYPL